MSNSTNTDNPLADFEKYRYHPSLPAAALFTGLFALTTLAHLFQLIRARTWFMIPFLVGGILEVVGYIGRIISSTEEAPYTLPPYILQTIALLVAPAFLAASVYMHLGRVATATGAEDKLLVRRKWLTKIFVGGDVASFLMQAGGGGLMASGSGDTISTGENLIVAGLFVQIAFFGMFVVVAGLFHFRVARTGKRDNGTPWRKHLMSLYVVSVLIFIRSIIRVVEYLQGYDGYIISHEVFLYVFDAALMVLAMVVMNVIHPGEISRTLRYEEEKESAKKFSGSEDGADNRYERV